MNKKLLKYCMTSIFALFVAIICIFALSYSQAYAWTTTEWRPSIEIRKSIDASNARIDECNAALESSANFVAEYEGNSGNLNNKVNDLQNKFDEMDNYIKEERPELEEVTKNSYAAYFAKDLLDSIVGSKLVTEGLFRWGFVTWVACGEDEEIVAFIEDYFNTQKELAEAIKNRDDADNTYKQSLTNLQNMPNEIEALNANLAHMNSLLPEILEIESVYGAAGESRIEGSNVFCHPCPDGQISSSFHEFRDGYTHQGCDFAAPTSTPIYAAGDGVVIETGSSASMGNYIKIQHDGGLVSIYMHCSHIYVPNGMHVCKGDNIALVGSTGDSTGPHLHFQVELDGTPVNGLDYL